MHIATIGTGFIVDAFLHAVEQVDGAKVVAVYSRKEATGKKLADKFAITKVYTDMESMLADDDIDCIYVASPNSLHYTYSKQALQAGKHVICEKPFTSTLKELDEIIALAKEKNLFLWEAIVTKHMPNYLKIKELLPQLGAIRMVQCNFSQYSSRYDKFLAGETPNVFNPAFSGGALSDINIYNLHFVMGLFGNAQKYSYYPNIQRNIDTSGILLMEYDTFQAVCVGCKDSASTNIAQIQGEKGYITLHSETSRCASFTLTIGKETKDLSLEQNPNALYYEIVDFVEMFKAYDTKQCYAMLEESRKVIAVYETARIQAGIIFPADNQS